MNLNYFSRKTAIYLIAVFCFVISIIRPAFASEKYCSYSTYRWNVQTKTAVLHKRVKHLYSELDSFEIDKKTGCSVCEEDQETVIVAKVPPFKICKRLAPKLRFHLSRLINRGAPIEKIIGYRVGMTRGKVDSNGNRTQFSNHSFGIAIDINDEQNGLYDQCLEFNENCRLRKGGKWDAKNSKSLKPNSLIVQTLKKIGFKWGGEIKGKQKDFMHFSPTGY